MVETNNHRLVDIMSKGAAQSLSAREITRLLLASDIGARLDSELTDAVIRIIDRDINHGSYRRQVLRAVYEVAELIADVEDRPRDITKYIRDNVDVEELEILEQRVSYELAARTLSIFYPRKRIMYFKKVHLSQRIQEALAAERDKYLDRVVKAIA